MHFGVSWLAIEALVRSLGALTSFALVSSLKRRGSAGPVGSCLAVAALFWCGWLVHPSLTQSLADEERQGGYTSKSEASQGCGSVAVAVNDGKGTTRTEL